MSRADELFAQMGYDPAVAAEMGVPQYARLPEQGPIVEPRWPEWLPWGSDILAEQAMRFMSPGDVPSWQMPYPMPATQGERDVLSMLPVAGDVEDVRYLMEGIHQGDPAMAAMGGAAAMMPFVPASLLHTVYHGSPHIFDAFKMERIGTGEGAQAFGHGLYFAEEPGVAGQYREALSGGISDIQASTFSANPEKWTAGQLDAGIDEQQIKQGAQVLGYQGDMDALLDAGRRELETARQAGALYKVEIPDEAVGRMLDWDKPLSEQPESVREAWEQVEPGSQALFEMSPLSGMGDIFAEQLRDPTFTQRLQELGIPGIRYLDQGSRGTSGGQLLDVFEENGKWRSKIKVENRAGGFGVPTDMVTTSKPYETEEQARKWAADKIEGGTRNLVLFDESLAKIIERK